MVCLTLPALTAANDIAEARDRDADETQSYDRDPADPEFSLISGTLRSKKTYGTGSAPEQEAVEGIKDLTLRNQDFSLSKLESAGSEYFAMHVDCLADKQACTSIVDISKVLNSDMGWMNRRRWSKGEAG